MEKNFQEEIVRKGIKYDIYDWAESALFSLVCVFLIFVFVGRIASVNGESMEPTLQNGERVISSRLFYTPAYGDIVVVTMPNDRDNEPLIKRIIATEGQTVDIDFEMGMVYIDGVALEEPYTMAPTYEPRYDYIQFPQTVPEGHVLVMGDNRNNSWDGRAVGIGMVDERYILGRIVLRITPFDRFGNPDAYWEE